ncbi:MAG: hypothetical protein AAGD25_23970 [Cyanobacteria bacterium P01_F01_bin.150]
MTTSPQPSDWKVFRELREVALERFCDRVLTEMQTIATDPSQSALDRYHRIHDLIQEHGSQLAQAFDNPRRSHMKPQIMSIVGLNLLHGDEISRFSADIQALLQAFVDRS